MKTPITLVTGNADKLRELQAIAAAKDHTFTHQKLDLEELQSLSLREITEHKVRQAYEKIGSPALVEDVAAGLESLHGLPGPFIKFFNERLGPDALYKLSKIPGDNVTITCLTAYFDGEKLLFGEGIVEGTITSPRGNNGFGFDCCIIPKGETRTMAEMPPEEKNHISHRARAFRNLLRQLPDAAPQVR